MRDHQETRAEKASVRLQTSRAAISKKGLIGAVSIYVKYLVEPVPHEAETDVGGA